MDHDDGICRSCSCNMFNNRDIVCQHLVCYYTFEGLSELPKEMILDRWRIHCRTTQYSVARQTREMFMQICDLILNCAGKSDQESEGVVEILSEFISWFHCHSGSDTSIGERDINSISQLEQLRVGPVRIPIPAIVRTKGCGRRGGPPKSYVRFKSTKKVITTWKISANSRKSTHCGEPRHN